MTYVRRYKNYREKIWSSILEAVALTLTCQITIGQAVAQWQYSSPNTVPIVTDKLQTVFNTPINVISLGSIYIWIRIHWALLQCHDITIVCRTKVDTKNITKLGSGRPLLPLPRICTLCHYDHSDCITSLFLARDCPNMFVTPVFYYVKLL